MERTKIELNASNHPGWWTGDELNFLRQLAARKDRTAFDGYAASLGRRERWDRIDRQTVMREAEKLKAQAPGAEPAAA